MSLDWSQWRSCHLYYHGDGNLLLDRLVCPLAGSLLREGSIDRFFFIRYELGGPHVRLRLRVVPGAGDTVNAAVAAAAKDFFVRWPSAQPLSAEILTRRAREVLAANPAETDATLYPDNSLHFFPFAPEADRYGGPELIGASLDFFMLSSLRALDFVRAFGGEPLSRQIPWMLRTLAGQAFGFARDELELLRLLGYARVGAGHPLGPFAARGDRAFEEQPDAFRALLLEVLAAGERERGPLDEARRLGAAIHRAAPALRASILRSHMHMAANRLGIRNPQEAFLSQILWRAAAGEPEKLAPALRDTWRSVPGDPLDADEGLEHLLPTVFATLCEAMEPAASQAGAFRRRCPS